MSGITTGLSADLSRVTPAQRPRRWGTLSEIGEAIGPGFDMGMAGPNPGSNAARYEAEVYDEIVKSLNARGYKRTVSSEFLGVTLARRDRPLRNPHDTMRMAGGTGDTSGIGAALDAVEEQEVLKALAREQARDPKFLANIKGPEGIAAEVARRRQADMQAAQQLVPNSTAGTAGAFIGQVGAAFTDPITLITLPLGAGQATAQTVLGRALQTAGTEALVQGGVSLAMTPLIAVDAAGAGFDYGLDDAALDVAVSMTAGAVFGAVAGAVQPAIPPAVREAEVVHAAERAIAAASPFERTPQGDAEHQARLVAVADAVARGEPVPELPEPVTPLGRAAVEIDEGAGEIAKLEAEALAELRANVPEAAPPPAAEVGPEARAPFDPVPHLAAARDHVKAGGSLKPDAVGRALGLKPDEAERVLQKLAADPKSGLFVTRRGGIRRRPTVTGPQDVIEYLARHGGLRDDEGHDLRNLAGLGTHFIPGSGPLIRGAGMGLDEAGELLAEAGYFGARGTVEAGRMATITERDVLELLERASAARDKGQRVYVPEQQVEADAARTAASAAEADEAARQAAIDDLTAAIERDGGSWDRAEIEAMAGSWRTYLASLPEGAEPDLEAFVLSFDADSWAALDAARRETGDDAYDVPWWDDMEDGNGNGGADTGGDAGSAGEGGQGPAPFAGDAGAGAEGAGTARGAADGASPVSDGTLGAPPDANGAALLPDTPEEAAARVAASLDDLRGFDGADAPGAVSQTDQLVHDLLPEDGAGVPDLREDIGVVNDALRGGVVYVSQEDGQLFVNLGYGRRIEVTKPGELTAANARTLLQVADRAARIAEVDPERAAQLLKAEITGGEEEAARRAAVEAGAAAYAAGARRTDAPTEGDATGWVQGWDRAAWKAQQEGFARLKANRAEAGGGANGADEIRRGDRVTFKRPDGRVAEGNVVRVRPWPDGRTVLDIDTDRGLENAFADELRSNYHASGRAGFWRKMDGLLVELLPHPDPHPMDIPVARTTVRQLPDGRFTSGFQLSLDNMRHNPGAPRDGDAVAAEFVEANEAPTFATEAEARAAARRNLAEYLRLLPRAGMERQDLERVALAERWVRNLIDAEAPALDMGPEDGGVAPLDRTPSTDAGFEATEAVQDMLTRLVDGEAAKRGRVLSMNMDEEAEALLVEAALRGEDAEKLARKMVKDGRIKLEDEGEPPLSADVEPLPPSKVVPAPAQTVKSADYAGAALAPEEAAARLEAWKAEAKALGAQPRTGQVVISMFDASGVMAQPWRDMGFEVEQWDIKLGDDLLRDMPDYLERIEAMRAEGKEVVAVLAQPPCTTFAGSGARWWDTRHNRQWDNMVRKMWGEWAAKHFDSPVEYNQFLVMATEEMIAAAEPPVFLIENPVGRIERMAGLPDPLLVIEPHHFGAPYTKRTHLWGKFNPELPTAPVDPTEGSRMHKLRGNDEKQAGLRSLTPEGFAYAFALANVPGGRPAAALDMGPAVDPAIAARNRQLGQLAADSPLRPGDRAEQADVDGLPMFDAARSPDMFGGQAPVAPEPPAAAVAATDSALDDVDRAAVAAAYGAPGYDDATRTRFLQDVVTAINSGIEAVADTVRPFVRKVITAVLAAVMTFSPVNMRALDLDVGAARAAVTTTVELRKDVPAAARAQMSDLAAGVYEAAAPAAIQRGKGFIIADKPGGTIHIFDAKGNHLASGPALYGKGAGDVLPERVAGRMDDAPDSAKVTPAGTFTMVKSDAPGYAGGSAFALADAKTQRAARSEFDDRYAQVAIHAVYTGAPAENRGGRLASKSAADNKTSWGCINTTNEEFLNVLLPRSAEFDGGTVFVLPDQVDATAGMFPAQKVGVTTPRQDPPLRAPDAPPPAVAILRETVAKLDADQAAIDAAMGCLL